MAFGYVKFRSKENKYKLKFYSEKKSLGLCHYGSCKEKKGEGIYCNIHRLYTNHMALEKYYRNKKKCLSSKK